MLPACSLPTCAAMALLAFTTATALGDEPPFFCDDPWLRTTARGQSPESPAMRGLEKTEDVTGVLFFWPSAAEPQGGTPGPDDALASDRPDFVEASCTVGKGVLQVEMGYTLFYDDDGVTRTVAHTFPETLYRLGLFEDWFELRIGWTYASETTTVGGVKDTVSGSSDLYVGAKLGLTPQQGLLPEMSIVPQALVPVGGPFSNDRVLPGVNWLYGWDFNDFLNAGGSTQVNMLVDDGSNDTFLLFAQAFTIGYTLSDKLGAYTEWFMLSPHQADTATTEHYLDAGLTYKISNDLQLDIRAGKGVSDAAVDFFTGAGAVVRF
jgi:hypothetical protein